MAEIFTNEEIEKWKKELEDLIAYHFPRDPDSAAMEKILALRRKLEAKGFMVLWSVRIVDFTTLKAVAKVTLIPSDPI